MTNVAAALCGALRGGLIYTPRIPLSVFLEWDGLRSLGRIRLSLALNKAHSLYRGRPGETMNAMWTLLLVETPRVFVEMRHHRGFSSSACAISLGTAPTLRISCSWCGCKKLKFLNRSAAKLGLTHSGVAALRTPRRREDGSGGSAAAPDRTGLGSHRVAPRGDS